MTDELPSLNLPHVHLGEEGGRIVVQVDDDELFDFVEDFLTESSNLTCEHVLLPVDVESVNTMYFPVGVSRHTVEAALRKLDPIELERIFRINNLVRPNE